VTTAQAVFVVALGMVAVLITVVSVYVASSTRWGDRWYRRRSGRP
jgi:hypothetical protein